MPPSPNRRIVLAQRPAATPGPEHFRREDLPRRRRRMANSWCATIFCRSTRRSAAGSAPRRYAEPVAIGAVMRSLAVGVVTATRHASFAVGECLYGWFGWQDFCVAGETSVLARVDPANGPASTALGIFGITGLTAYLALYEIGRPQPGETVLVSTAAGAVGSLVGQLARRAGCRVVGITGER